MDVDGCTEIQCFEGVECIDVIAPGVGAECGPCPDGLKRMEKSVKVILEKYNHHFALTFCI